MIFWIWTV